MKEHTRNIIDHSYYELCVCFVLVLYFIFFFFFSVFYYDTINNCLSVLIYVVWRYQHYVLHYNPK